MNYGRARVKWAVYVSLCAVDIKEAWQTCPLSADGGIHNSICRQFHAVSLPLSSLFPQTERKRFGLDRRKRRLQVVCSTSPAVVSPNHPNNTHNGLMCNKGYLRLCVFMLIFFTSWTISDDAFKVQGSFIVNPTTMLEHQIYGLELLMSSFIPRLCSFNYSIWSILLINIVTWVRESWNTWIKTIYLEIRCKI